MTCNVFHRLFEGRSHFAITDPSYVVENNAAWGDAPLPDLRNWSEVVFFTWLRLTDGGPE